jgi:hypothetical protein
MKLKSLVLAACLASAGGYVAAKLQLRRLAASHRAPDSEGIPPWELSYVEEHALYTRFASERLRPRNYSPTGLRHREHQTIAQ